MQLPKQRVPLSEKQKKDWQEGSVRAVIAKSKLGQTPTRRSDLADYYDAYYGILDPKQFSYVVNPYNTKDSKLLNFPARLRNYNIIAPVVDLHLGEFLKRPMDWMVAVKGADVETKLQEETRKAIIQGLEQEFVNGLNEAGMDTGMPSKDVPTPRDIAQMKAATYKDIRAVMGQDAIDYIIANVDWDYKTVKAFKDWLIAGMAFTYRGVEHDEVVYEMISPFDIDYSASRDVDFKEDGDWQVCRRRMTANAIVDRFYDMLSEKDIDFLSDKQGDGGSEIVFTIESDSRPDRPDGDDTPEGEFDVYHVVWKSYRKIGILTYLDEYGMDQQMEVDETYRPDKTLGETVEWYWVDEVWNGWTINQKIFFGVAPLMFQRGLMGNPSAGKMPYNGIVGISLVKTGLAYQILYDIFHYRLEQTVAKNKGKIALMEINAIPKRHGWTEDKFMYYADVANFAFIDSTAEGKNNQKVTFNQYQVLDMTLGNYLNSQFQLLQFVRDEWEERSGVPRQRKGQTLASDGVGANERAIYQSAVITEWMFFQFEKMLEKDMRALHDYSKVAWRDGKKTQYINRQGREAFLNIDGELYAETEYGIFVKNAGKEKEKLEGMRNLALAFAQNDADPSVVAEILDATSFAKLKVHLKQVEDAKREFEAAQAEEERRAQAEQQQQMLEAQAQQAAELQARQDEADRKKMEFEDKKLAQERELEEARLAVEREKIHSQERQNRVNQENL